MLLTKGVIVIDILIVYLLIESPVSVWRPLIKSAEVNCWRVKSEKKLMKAQFLNFKVSLSTRRFSFIIEIFLEIETN